MPVSALFLLDNRGKILLSRNYRDDVQMEVIEGFMQQLLEQEDEFDMLPVIPYGNVTFVYTKNIDVYLVAVTNKNANVVLIMTFLLKVIQSLKEYFQELEEESVRDNFVLIYELLDEFVDFGYPQITEPKILQKYITQDGVKLSNEEKLTLGHMLTGYVSWRPEGINYKKNEVFLDVIESVNILANANGTVVKSDITGTLNMRVYLSGRPELRLGLNDKVLFQITGRGNQKGVELEDVKFHQCVRLSRFENDRTIAFIPPDGEFDLMTYRLNAPIRPLIWVDIAVEYHSHSRIEYMLKAKSQFKKRNTANNVEIIVPVPPDVDGAKFKTTVGNCKYTPEKNQIVWSIRSFSGGKEYLMKAHFNLPSVQSETIETKPPIQIRFEIPYFTVSGIQVRYLKILERSGYPALPWVRYLTRDGNYLIRT